MAAAGWALRLWRMSPRVPIVYGGDALAGLGHVKTVHDTGWWFTNPHLGAPMGLEHYDFPSGGESLQVAMVRFLTLFTDSAPLVMNTYFLLTFALVAVSAYLVVRHLGLSPLVATVVSVLYSVLPFHFWHGTPHIYRSGYFAAPVASLVLLWLMGADGDVADFSQPGFRRIRFSRRRLALIALAVLLVGTTDTVAAAFVPVLAGLIGLVRWIRDRDYRPFVVALSFGVAILGLVIAVNLPTLIYQRNHGPNTETVQRQTFEGEFYALKISRMVLPSEDHPIPALADLGKKAAEGRIPSEGGQALGIIGTFGFVAALVLLLRAAFQTGREQPPPANDEERRRWTLAVPAGAIIMIAVLVSVPGGLSFLLALAGFEEIRTWNRIVVYLGFFALLTFGLLADEVRTRLHDRGFRHTLPAVILLGVLGLGVYDQSPGTPPNYRAIDEAWAADASFFGGVENLLADQSDPMVFNLPRVPYPEPPHSFKVEYGHMRGYLHTDRIAWSYGAMKGRPASEWQKQLARLPAQVALDAVTAVGFDGVYLDTWGYDDGGEAIRTEFGVPPDLTDARQQYFSLADRRALLESLIGADGMEQMAQEVLWPVTADLGPGFHRPGAFTTGGSFGTDRAEFTLDNPLGESRSVRVRIEGLTAPGGPYRVGLARAENPTVILAEGLATDRVFALDLPTELPPGSSSWVLTTDGPEFQSPGDQRQINLAVSEIRVMGPVTATIFDRLPAQLRTDQLIP